jgi:hypothetical protein
MLFVNKYNVACLHRTSLRPAVQFGIDSSLVYASYINNDRLESDLQKRRLRTQKRRLRTQKRRLLTQKGRLRTQKRRLRTQKRRLRT